MNRVSKGKKQETIMIGKDLFKMIIIGKDLFKMIELKEKGWSVLWTGEGKICLVKKGEENEK